LDAEVLTPIDPVVFSASGYGEEVSVYSLEEFGCIAFVHRCDPDEPAPSIACPEKASQQSNIENLDAIATEAFLDPRGGLRGWVCPSDLRNQFLKRFTGPGVFDLKGITVVKRPSLEREGFVLAVSRQKYASLVSTYLEIQRAVR
jgi:hypothetical protein